MAEAHGLKLGDAMQPVRVALTGSTVSEPVNELLAVVEPRRARCARLREVAPRAGGRGRRARRDPRGPASRWRLAGAGGLRGQPAAQPHRAPARRYRLRRRRPLPLPGRSAPASAPLHAPCASPSSATSTSAPRRCPTGCRPTAAAACSTRRGPRSPATWSSATSKACSPTPACRTSASACAPPSAGAGSRQAPRRAHAADTADRRPGCYAFRTPTALAPRLVDAGFTHLNLANNHANDYGPGGTRLDRAASSTAWGSASTARSAGSRSTPSAGATASRPSDSIGFTTYPYAYDLLDIERSAAVVDSVRPLVDLLVVTFHGGTEGRRAPCTCRETAESLGSGAAG